MSSIDPYPWQPRPNQGGGRRRQSLLGPLLLVLAFCGSLLSLAYLFRPQWFHTGSDRDPNAVPRAVTARGDLAGDEKATIDLYNATKNCVVHITTLANRQDRFSLNVEQVPEGTGSGFIWDDRGHVVTNYHVIRGAAAARVTMADQSNWKARLVGAFPDRDLAVLKIDAPKGQLIPIPVGRSDDLQVGQKTFAIGNPFGLDQTLTNGIVSALGREIESVNQRSIKNMIQTNAAINPGNSGGPLLDSAGRLIGVNTAIFSPSGASAGIGFAIPVDEVNRVVPDLIRNGKIERPGLGIQVAPDQWTRQLNQEGVMVAAVLPGSGAAQAGMRGVRKDASGRILIGDIITAIDGKPIKKVKDLNNALDNRKAGDTVEVTVLRDDESIEMKVELVALE